MGVEGEDFIDNPNRTEYVDDDEIDLDEHVDIFVDYVDEDQDDVLIYTSDDDALNDTASVHVDDLDGDDDCDNLFYADDSDAFFTGDSDNFLSDFDEDEDSDGELRGYMSNGVFRATNVNPPFRLANATVVDATGTESEAKNGNDTDNKDGNGDNNDDVVGTVNINTPQTAAS